MSTEQESIDEWIQNAPICLDVSTSINDERITTENRVSGLTEMKTERHVTITATARFTHEESTRRTR